MAADRWWRMTPNDAMRDDVARPASEPATEASGPKAAAAKGERVWLRLATAAELVDLTPAALRKRLARHAPPPGVVKRWGGSYFVHRERFMRWLDRGQP